MEERSERRGMVRKEMTTVFPPNVRYTHQTQELKVVQTRYLPT